MNAKNVQEQSTTLNSTSLPKAKEACYSNLCMLDSPPQEVKRSGIVASNTSFRTAVRSVHQAGKLHLAHVRTSPRAMGQHGVYIIDL
jgi:hypothetical protein